MNYYLIVVNIYIYDFKDYCIERIPLRINLIIYDDKKIEKVLNTLKKKNHFKEEFTGRNHVRFNQGYDFCQKTLCL